jgi:hypothetical protein
MADNLTTLQYLKRLDNDKWHVTIAFSEVEKAG